MAQVADSRPQVEVVSGPLAGVADGRGGALFLGVPYAAPPTGARRWRAPRKPVPWKQIRQAVHEAPACPQNDYGWNAFAASHASEDCLYLDIHTPDLHPQHLLPVLVWIHGGGNRAGTAAGTVHSGLVQRGIVVVAIQYRLGVLGFLSSPTLSAEQGGHSGNYGLMDQLHALAWIQRNIARFGGDPRQVTLAGQSAGGMDVALLTIFNSNAQLFARSWATGGVPMSGEPVRSLQQSETIGMQLGRLLDTGDDLAALRKLPVSALLAAARKLHHPVLGDDGYMWLQATVDGRVVAESPAKVLARGVVDAVPLVLSTNRIELPVPGGKPRIKHRLRQSFGSHVSAATHFYGLGGKGIAVDARDASHGSLLQRMGTDTGLRCPANHVLNRYVAHGGLAWRAQVSVEKDHKRSHHSAELPFLFDNLPLRKDGKGATLQDYFVRFIKTGNPNGPGLTSWARVTLDGGQYVDFTQRGVIAGHHLGGAICRLYDPPR